MMMDIDRHLRMCYTKSKFQLFHLVPKAFILLLLIKGYFSIL